MASMTEMICACGCGKKKMVRTADVKRGWGKYYSKSCKAKAQTKRTGRKGRGLTKEQRYEKLVEAFDEGRISEEYYFFTLNEEYPEFIKAEDSIDVYHATVHPFSDEALGQW